MARLLGLQFLRRKPQRADDALIQGSAGDFVQRFGGEGEAQVVATGLGRLPLVGADHVGDAHVPAGFLAGFADRGFQQALVRLEVAGGLVDHQVAVGAFLHAQQTAIADHHGGHGHVGLPETAFAIAHRAWDAWIIGIMPALSLLPSAPSTRHGFV